MNIGARRDSARSADPEPDPGPNPIGNERRGS